MLACTGRCVWNKRKPEKAAAPGKTGETLRRGASAEKEKPSQPQKHAGGNETGERKVMGEELGGMNDLFIQRSRGCTKEQALYKITWHPEPERNCLKQNIGLDDS